MFFHLKNAITICVATACLMGSGAANAQAQSNNPEFSRRMAALQQARQRTTSTTVVTQQTAQTVPPITRASVANNSQPVRVAQAGSSTRSFAPSGGFAPQAGSSTRSIAPSGGFAPQAGSSTRSIAPSGGFVPQHLSSPVVGETIIDGGSPIVHEGIIDGQIISSHTVDAPIGSSIVGNEVIVDAPYGGVVTEGHAGCDCGGGSCGSGSCGDIGESYFGDDCCGRGGCPEGPCFLNNFGKIFRNAEYFGGFNAFRTNLFTALDGSNNLVDDSSHGLFAGFNLGVPLCRLSCGFFSGQFGVRTVNTNFGGAAFTDDDRNQIFITTGIYRRVDHGLQLGVVADILREEWFSDVDLVQVRGEIGYVWQGGTSLGFRFATNTEDDVTEGVFNNEFFSDNLVTSNDWYRFFLRHEIARGGYGEIYGGWTDNEQGIVGLDFDFPITDRIAFQSGFTYYLSDDEIPADQGFLGGEPNDSFNIFVGFSLRPSGRSYYRNYDRPLFDVADNGTFTIFRQ